MHDFDLLAGGMRLDAHARQLLSLADELSISRISDITGMDTIGLPNVVAIRPRSRSLSVHGGKGVSSSDAVKSALYETAEFVALERPPENAAVGNLAAELTKSTDVAAYLRAKVRVGAPLCELGLLVPMRSLLNGQVHAIPWEAISVDFRVDEHRSRFIQDTNGTGAGRKGTDAIVRALYELIERHDASTWFSETSLPERAIPPLRSPATQALASKLRRGCQRAVHFLLSRGWPYSVASLLCDEPMSARPLGWFWGFAAAGTLEGAVVGAALEAAQCRLAQIVGVRDDIDNGVYQGRPTSADLSETLRMVRRARRRPLREPLEHAGAVPPERELSGLVAAAIQRGASEVLVLELTVTRTQIAVAKVIAPGLRGLPSDWAPHSAPHPELTATG